MRAPEIFLPTKEQRAAIEVRGSAVVRAGAGSGKTSVLAARYIHLLEQGALDRAVEPQPLRVEQILAITFTDKAASEMKERIRGFLAERLARADAASRAALERARRDLVGAQICTIHSFCAHLLKAHPIESGVDPAATVLEPRQAAAFLAGVIEKGLRRAVEENQPFARRLVKRHGLSGAVTVMVGLLEEIERANLRAPDLPAGLAEQEKEAAAAASRLAAQISAFSQVLQQWLSDHPDDGVCAALRDRWPEWERHLSQLSARPRADLIVAFSHLASLLPTRSSKVDLTSYLRLERGALRGSIPELAGFLASLPLSAQAVDLVVAVAKEAEAAKRSQGVLTFDDLISWALDLLLHNPAVRERCQERYRALLVDEFQDTDPRQGEIIRLLARGGRTLLFLVGDEKQAIYGFRGADVEIIGRFRALVGRELVLRTNFRARPALLGFVNALAALTMRPPGPTPAPYWVQWEAGHELAPHRPQPAEREAPVTLLSLVGAVAAGDLSSEEARQIEADCLAGMIGRMCAGGGRRYGDIAILLRAMTAVSIYQEALRRYGIPYSVVKTGSFFDCQEVQDLINLLAAVADPGENLALAAVLRSPIFGLSDEALYRLASAGGFFASGVMAREDFSDLGEEEAVAREALGLLRRLVRLRDRWTPAEIVEEAVRSTDFEVVLLGQLEGIQRVANVRKFIELARQAERKQHLTLGEFVRYTRQLLASGYGEPEAAVSSGSEDVVSVMSVHQAKGLEFPVVILPDLARTVGRKKERLAVNSTYGIVAVEEVGAAGTPVPHELAKRLHEGAVDRARAEEVRLLYVALTRARDALILSEGKGRLAFLRSSRPAQSWIEHVWDLIGRRQVLALAEGSDREAWVRVKDTAVRLVKPEALAPSEKARAVAPARAGREEGGRGEEVRAALRRALHFTPTPPEQLTVSPVELERFHRCPRMYLLERAEVEGPGSGVGPEAGSVGHAVLQTIDLFAPPADLPAAIAASLDLHGGRLLDPPVRERLAAALVEGVRWMGGRYRGCEIAGREVPFVLWLGPGGTNVTLRGRIDLVLRDERGLCVVDYKFAARPPADRDRYFLQMAAYAAALRRALPGEQVRCEILYLGGAPGAVVLKAATLAALEGGLGKIAAALLDALREGSHAAFPKAGADGAACGSWGCPHVASCWGRC